MTENKIVVLDFETGGLDTEFHEVIQVAALALDPASLTPIAGGEFESMMRPLFPERLQEQALRVNGKTREELAEAPHPGEVWHRFAKWMTQWNFKGRSTDAAAPIMAGHNIARFDMKLYERYCKEYKTTRFVKRTGVWEPTLFGNKAFYDTQQILRMFFEGLPEKHPVAMDSLRKFMRMPDDLFNSSGTSRSAHDALRDVRDTAALLGMLLRLTRRVSEKTQWEGCFDAAYAAARIAERKARREAAKEREDARKERAGAHGGKPPWN